MQAYAVREHANEYLFEDNQTKNEIFLNEIGESNSFEMSSPHPAVHKIVLLWRPQRTHIVDD